MGKTKRDSVNGDSKNPADVDDAVAAENSLDRPPSSAEPPAKSPAANKSPPLTKAQNCPIVGIGASAGGLEAFSELIKHLPVDTDMAFVLVQHMGRTHESLLPQLLSKTTSMPVHQVHDGMAIEPNQIFVIPPTRACSSSTDI